MLTSLSQRTSGGGYTDKILLDFAIDSDRCWLQAISANYLQLLYHLIGEIEGFSQTPRHRQQRFEFRIDNYENCKLWYDLRSGI